MSLLEACRLFEASWVSTTIRDSKWGFALIEMVHLSALAVLGGALFVTGLRVWGFVFKAPLASQITRDLGWLLIGSFATMLISGVLLFADGPLRYYGNIAFRVKLSLIGAATIAGLATHLVGARRQVVRQPPPAMKLLALLSCTLSLGAAIAGRVIGVL